MHKLLDPKSEMKSQKHNREGYGQKGRKKEFVA